VKTLVQKFGGTCVATGESRDLAVERIREARDKGYGVVVVVSAMGRAGDPYATDTLLELARGRKDSSVCRRELDLLMSCGEIISAVVLTADLVAAGIPTVSMTGPQAGVITDSNFGEARIIEVQPEKVVDNLAKGQVVVVTGFQGRTADGEITTLGRGGSDTTAVALGTALDASAVEIYTDVDGVMTADPRIEPNARILNRITYREVVEMAHLGAKVIHPRAVEIAMSAHLPIWVRSLDGRLPGTLIQAEHVPENVEIHADKVVTGIAHIDGMAHVRIRPAGEGMQEETLRLMENLAQAGISLDLIYVSPQLIAFIILEECVAEAEKILTDTGLVHEIHAGFAKVSAVGAGMRGVPGVMARIMRAFARDSIVIHQTCDSHATISCLVRSEHMSKAVRALHEEFGLGA